MTIKQIRLIGIKKYIVFLIFCFIETLINIPYYILKAICFPFYLLYDRFMYANRNMFYLSRIKYVNRFALDIKCKLNNKNIDFDKLQ